MGFLLGKGGLSLRKCRFLERIWRHFHERNDPRVTCIRTCREGNYFKGGGGGNTFLSEGRGPLHERGWGTRVSEVKKEVVKERRDKGGAPPRGGKGKSAFYHRKGGCFSVLPETPRHTCFRLTG